MKPDTKHAAARAVRRELEALHQNADNPRAAVEKIWPHLSSEDRHIRYAARVALEHQDVDIRDWYKDKEE